MIKPKHLSSYPNPNTLDPAIEEIFEKSISCVSGTKEKFMRMSVVLFRTFLDIIGSQFRFVNLNYSKDDVFKCFVGFVYVELDARLPVKYSYCMHMQYLLKDAYFKPCSPERRPLILSTNRINNAISKCITKYKLQGSNQLKIKYYEGWFVTCKKGNKMFLNLSHIEHLIDTESRDKLFKAVESYSAKKNFITTRSELSSLKCLLMGIAKLCPTKESYKLLQQPENVNAFMLQLFSLEKLKVKSNGGSIRAFYSTQWSKIVKCAQLFFINSGVWPNPPVPIFNPTWKSSFTTANTNIFKDQDGSVFNSKMITYIPLFYSDEKAIKNILKCVERDIKHVSSACQRVIDATMAAFRRRKELAACGQVKKYKVNDTLDMTKPVNQVTTWEYYKWDLPAQNKAMFLGRQSNSRFAEEFGILGSNTLLPFVLLLIEQHPVITESWLINFELFDKNEKMKGFRQSGRSWIVDSVKLRKGSKLAQQVITLNSVSKLLLENIIELTSDARQRMKETRTDDSWRYLLLSSASGLAEPKRITRLHTFAAKHLQKSTIGRALLEPSETVSKDTARTIVSNLGCSTMRASCGVRVYLKTKSVKAMSEALGHENYNPKLLSSYLPEPILSYFQGRWVRIFQNALIYEGMKESDYLLDVIDIEEKDLAKFLQNHALKPLPQHILDGQITDLKEETKVVPSQLNDAVIPVSLPLLKVMNALVELVDNAPNGQRFTDIVCDWYDTATFVRQSILAGVCSKEITDAMKEAELKPLPVTRLRGAVYVT